MGNTPDPAVAALPPAFKRTIEHATGSLIDNLHENLASLVLYGSAVRGNVDARSSDINLFILLHQSTPEAHRVIAELAGGTPRIDPMVLPTNAMQRAMRVFALKFLSMRRNYVVLAGSDPLRDLGVR